MNKYTGKNPLVYRYIKHAVLLLSQTVVGYTRIRFDDNISIIISSCLNKSRKDIWQQWDYCWFHFTRGNGHITRGNGHLRAVTFGNARCLVGPPKKYVSYHPPVFKKTSFTTCNYMISLWVSTVAYRQIHLPLLYTLLGTANVFLAKENFKMWILMVGGVPIVFINPCSPLHVCMLLCTTNKQTFLCSQFIVW